MQKITSLCLLILILLLSACSPGGGASTAPLASDVSIVSTSTQSYNSDDSSNTANDETPTTTNPSESSDSSVPSWADGLDDGSSAPTTASTTSSSEVNTSKPEVPEIRPPENSVDLYNPQKGGADAEAKLMRQSILKTQSNLKITGTTYYVSPKGDDDANGTSPSTAWETFDAVMLNNYLFEPGDAVLFERGGIYRKDFVFPVSSGMTFGAYGTGDKPAIYGSLQNYAQPGLWVPSNKKNVWKIDLRSGDAGLIVFDHGKAAGFKKFGLLDVNNNGDFYHNLVDNILYLYLDKGYPNVVYESIEIGTFGNMFMLNKDATDITIDNLTLKYCGSHAIGTRGFNQNVRITNCEIGWIGGSKQSPTAVSSKVRYGNGIQFWNSIENATIENNWVYQIFDTGITFQGDGYNIYSDISFSKNLVEYAACSFEFFDIPEASINNIKIDDNISRFCGYGIGYLRDSHHSEAHISGWGTAVNNFSNFSIQNNIFDCSIKNIIFWYWNDPLKNLPELTVSNNTYYQKPSISKEGMRFANYGIVKVRNQSELEAAVKQFDEAPKLIKWLEN